MAERLTKEFFERESSEVAKSLCGKLLVREYDGSRLSAIITQSDAYALVNGSVKETRTNKGAFYPAAAIHMYPSQGQYMLAISTLRQGAYNEILIRRAEPLEGLERMGVNRNSRDKRSLTNGPGKIVQAFALDADWDSRPITNSEWGLWIENASNNECGKPNPKVNIDQSAPSGGKDFVGRYTLAK